MKNASSQNLEEYIAASTVITFDPSVPVLCRPILDSPRRRRFARRFELKRGRRSNDKGSGQQSKDLRSDKAKDFISVYKVKLRSVR